MDDCKHEYRLLADLGAKDARCFQVVFCVHCLDVVSISTPILSAHWEVLYHRFRRAPMREPEPVKGT